MKFLLLAAGIVALPIIKDKLEGRWETPVSPNGNVTGVVFKADHTFEGYVNKKPFVTGKYKVEDDVFSFTDNGCEGKEGVYRLQFFSNNDSLKFQCMNDSCLERKEGMSKLVLGRVKKN